MPPTRPFLLSVLALASLNANAVDDRWLTVEKNSIERPNEALTLRFAPDRETCQRAYGEDWYERCEFSEGHPGQVDGRLALKPQLAGEWLWHDTDTLTFRPKEGWPANTAFKLDLSPLGLTPSVHLDRLQRFATPPLNVTRSDDEFFFEPTPTGRRVAQLRLQLSTRPDSPEALEKAITLSASDPEVRLGTPRFIWNAAKTDLTIQVDVLQLGKGPSTLDVTVPGIAGKVIQKGNTWQIPTGETDAHRSVALPGLTTLFDVEHIRVRQETDEDLNQRVVLNFTTTLLTKTGDVAKALDVRLLPEKLDASALEATNWLEVPSVTDEMVKIAEPVAFEPLTADLSQHHRFALTAPANRFVVVSFKEGMGPEGPSTLNETRHLIVKVPEPTVNLAFLQPGDLLTLSGDRTLTVATQGAERLLWRTQRVRDPFYALANRLKAEDLSPDVLTEARSGSVSLSAPKTQAQYVAIELKNDFEPGKAAGLYVVTVDAQVKNDEGQWVTRSSEKKVLLMTDLNVLVKEDAHYNPTVTVMDLADHEALRGVEVSILARNGKTLATRFTNAQGKASFEGFAGLMREQAPTAVLVKRARPNDLAWISLEDPSNIDNNTRFGANGPALDDTDVVGTLFTERDLYRPGETVHFGGLLKRLDWATLPKDLPLTLSIMDPVGDTVLEKTVTPSMLGALTVDFPTSAQQTTGAYWARLSLGERLLSGLTFQVQGFEPETMTLTSHVENASKGWVTAHTATVLTKLAENNGSLAQNRTISGSLTIAPMMALRFDSLPDFKFLSPREEAPWQENAKTLSAQTNASGNAQLTLDLNDILRDGTAMLRLALTGTDASGAVGATESLSVNVSPMPMMLGINEEAIPTRLTAIKADTHAPLTLALVDPDLKPVAHQTVAVTLERRRQVPELATLPNGRAHYRTVDVTTPLRTFTVTTDAEGRAELTLPTETLGDFTLRFGLADGLKLGHVRFGIVPNGLKTQSQLDRLPTADVRLQTLKTDYSAGDTVEASLLSPFDGVAMVSLETNRVHATIKVPVVRGQNTVALPVPEGLSGRVWLTASVMRAKHDAKRFLSAYAHAVTPLFVGRREHTLDVSLTAPETLKINTPATLTLTSPKATQVFVWAVDEGILSQTGYEATSPLDALFGTRALTVQTRQYLSGLMPEGVSLPEQAITGGDMRMEARAASNLATNPFRRQGQLPAVWWGGLVALNPNEAKPITMTLPKGYHGKVRLYVMSTSEDALGLTKRSITVSAPLMTQVFLPPYLSPGDVATGTLSLMSTEGPIKGTASLTSEAFGLNTQTDFALDAKATNTVGFTVTAPKTPGMVEVRSEAQGTMGTTSLESENAFTVSVRPANYPTERQYWGRLTAGQTLPQLPERFALDRESSLTVSMTPVSLIEGLIKAALATSYPSDEETLTSAINLVHLGNRPELMTLVDVDATLENPEVAARLKAANTLAERLIARAAYDRPDNLRPLLLAVRYLMARQPVTGFSAQTDTLKQGLSLLKRYAASSRTTTLEDARLLAWTFNTLTQAGVMTGVEMVSLMEALDRQKLAWNTDATALWLRDTAERMYFKPSELGLGEHPYRLDTTQARLEKGLNGLDAFLALPTPLQSKADREAALASLDSTTLDSLSPLTRSLLVDALIAWSDDAVALPSGLTLSCEAGETGTVTTTETPYGRRVSLSGCTQWAINGAAEGLYWSERNAGWTKTPQDKAVIEGFQIEKTLTTANNAPLTGPIRLGDTITVTLRVTGHSGKANVRDLVSTHPSIVEDLLPAGFTWLGGVRDNQQRFKTDNARLTHVFLDDDRFTANVNATGDTYTVRYRLRATVMGTFTIPMARVTQMNDDRQWGTTGVNATITVLPRD